MNFTAIVKSVEEIISSLILLILIGNKSPEYFLDIVHHHFALNRKANARIIF